MLSTRGGWTECGAWVPVPYVDPTVAEEVFRATDARARMAEIGLKAPKANSMKHTIMGKVFDPAKPAEYLNSFAIKRT